MKRSTSWFAVLPSLVIPVCIGLMLYIGMLALIQNHAISDETVLRYLMGHPVSKITVAMFLIGGASLLMIGVNIIEQFRSERKITLDPDANENQNIAEQAVSCGQSLMHYPRWMHEHYLWQRLANALHSIYRTGSASHVEEELKYLADLDLEQQQQRYSLVQILIWATPMLGFLGTVLGISQALGGITVGPENDFQQMMDGLRGSLYVAFDTTALALTLSMVLMFGQFLVDRFESQLLQIVDQRARNEISNQFDLSATDSPGTNDQHELLTEQVIDALQAAVESQTEVWKRSITAAEQAWTLSLTDTNGKIETNLAMAIDKSVSDLAHYLGESIQKADHSMAHRWEQWQVLLSDNARLMAAHQTHLSEQTELIHKLLTQTEDKALFEPALSRNKNAIEQTTRLRETLAELSSVVSGLQKPPIKKTQSTIIDKPEVAFAFEATNADTTNAGDTNAGNTNAGDTNAGNTNAGDTNAGNTNVGNTNAGNTNVGNTNAGNTKAPANDSNGTEQPASRAANPITTTHSIDEVVLPAMPKKVAEVSFVLPVDAPQQTSHDPTASLNHAEVILPTLKKSA